MSYRVISPKIVLTVDENGTKTLTEFDRPADENGVFGYMVRYSYKVIGGDWVRNWADDYIYS